MLQSGTYPSESLSEFLKGDGRERYVRPFPSFGRIRIDSSAEPPIGGLYGKTLFHQEGCMECCRRAYYTNPPDAICQNMLNGCLDNCSNEGVETSRVLLKNVLGGFWEFLKLLLP